ncbi:hypothetical protein EWM64_g8880 [Hericium alpestre]|uniref:Uncharacterized protein n=1 Tax=Hericium alpestre TaxID=135208 RepID=A0A4Y9ZK67_9AGAM|nr:hypothetical protein EWM64_g8880 [Hericium alpestre]
MPRQRVAEDELVRAGPSYLQNRLYFLEQKQSENRQEIVRYKQEIVKYKQITEEHLRMLELKQRETEGELAELKALTKKQLAVQHRKDVVADEPGPLNANSSMRDQVKDAVAVRVRDGVKVGSNVKAKNGAKAKDPVDEAHHVGPAIQVRDAVKVGSNVKVKDGVKSKGSVDKVHHDDPASVAQGLEDTTPSRGDTLKVALNPSCSGETRLLLHDSSQDRPAERPPTSPKLKPTYHPVPSLDIAPRSSRNDLLYQYRALSPFPGVKFADLMADNPSKRWFGKNTPLTKDPLQLCPAALVTLSFPGLGANQTIYFTLTHGPFTSNDLGRLAARQIAAQLEEIAVSALLLVVAHVLILHITARRENVAVLAAAEVRRALAARAEARGSDAAFSDSVAVSESRRDALYVVEGESDDAETSVALAPTASAAVEHPVQAEPSPYADSSGRYYPGTYLYNPSYPPVDEPSGYWQSPFDAGVGRFEGVDLTELELPNQRAPVSSDFGLNSSYTGNSTIDAYGCDTYDQAALQGPAQPSSFPEMPCWPAPAPEEIPEPYPDDWLDTNALPPAQPNSWEIPSLYMTCDVPSPSAVSFADSLFDYLSGPDSPAATSVDSCSSDWPSEASFDTPAIGTALLCVAAHIYAGASSRSASGSGSKRRREDRDVVAQPAAKKPGTLSRDQHAIAAKWIDQEEA